MKAAKNQDQETKLKKFIKTQCGLEKYEYLRSKPGILNLVRLYWFVFFASIRDSIGADKK